MKKQCVVVIPLYLARPSHAEEMSFRRTLTVLRKHPIVIVTHRECDLSFYNSIAHQLGKQVGVEYFDKSYFRSVQAYNDMCFSASFYERFQPEYEYMLICQLDVWVFSDQLDYWCDRGYDYIGAPIYHAYTRQRFTQKFLGIGNGGFSLRRISHCLSIVKANRRVPYVKPWQMIQFYWNLCRYTEDFTLHWQKRLIAIPTAIAKCFGIGNTLGYYISNHVNEDLIFGTWANSSWGHHADLPSGREAARFAFEVNPEMLYHSNGDQLPFGCHAFEKWEFATFWQKHIDLSNKQI